MINEDNQPSNRKRSPIVIKRSTIIEMLILLIAASILIMALLSFNVNAQEPASTANTATNTNNITANNSTLPSDNYIPVTDSSDSSTKNFLNMFQHRFQEMVQKHVMGAF
jgi:flagellar basal body-associated protein FliL